MAALNDAFAALEADVRRLLEADGIAPADVALDRSAQMRYVGQSYEVTTPVPAGELDAAAVERSRARVPRRARARVRRRLGLIRGRRS